MIPALLAGVLALLPLLAVAGQTSFLRERVAAPVDDFADILLWMNGEGCGGSPCTTYDFHDTKEFPGTEQVDSVNSGWQVNTAAALAGTYGFDQGSGVERGVLNVTANDLFNPTQGRVCFQFRISSAAGPNMRQFYIDGTTDAQFEIATPGDDDFAFVWLDGSTDTCSTSFNGIAAGTTYLVEVAYDAGIGDGSDRISIYVDGVSRANCTNLTMSPLSGVSAIFVGGNASETGVTFMDTFVISDDPDRDCWALICNSTAGCASGAKDYPG